MGRRLVSVIGLLPWDAVFLRETIYSNNDAIAFAEGGFDG
jgi:hypothetical protein